MNWREATEIERRMESRPVRGVESDAEISARCAELYGVQAIEEIKKRMPEWREWTWARREKVLETEQERTGLGNI
jgi:hypothetical protein